MIKSSESQIQNQTIITGWIILFAISLNLGIVAAEISGALGLILVIYSRFRGEMPAPRRHPAVYALIAFVLFNSIAALFSENPVHSLKRFIQYYGFPFIGYTTILLLGRNGKNLRAGSIGLLISGFIGGIYALFQHFTGIDFFGHTLSLFREGARLNLYKPTGIFNLSLTFAGVQLVIALAVLPSLWEGIFRGRSSIFAWIAFGFTVLSLVITYQRSAWIGFGAGVLVFLALRREKSARIALVAFLVLCVIAAVSVPSIRGKILSTFNFSQANQAERLQMWPVAWNIGMEHPLTGVGPGMFGPYAWPHLPESMHHMSHAHNDLLQIWATTGFGGTLSALALAGLLLFVGLRELRKRSGVDPGSAHSVYEGALIAFLGFLIASLFQCYLIDGENAIAMGMILGWGLAARDMMHNRASFHLE